MSDSEDDVSVSGSEAEDVEDDDVDMEELEEAAELENPISDVDDNDVCSETGEKKSKWFQKEIWQHKKLPYYPELEKQANAHFANIKLGLANAVLLNDAAVGFLHWALELDKYIDLYGRRFSKEEHIEICKLMLTLVKKGNIFRNVKVAMHTFNLLMSKRDFLVRGDITIDWRPLYDLYLEVAYKNLEEDGIFLIPDGFRSELQTLIVLARNFFDESAVQELLDECRPSMCLWDESMIRAYKMLELFVPMNLEPERNLLYGCGLWLDEAWHWYSTIENNSMFEQHIMKMFARLSHECPGLIDWTDKLDLVFDKMIRSLRLQQVNGLCQSFNMDIGATWFSYMLGTKAHDSLISHLRRVMEQIESFLHPSNNGIHTQYLLNMMHKITHNIIARCKREKNEKNTKQRTYINIPESMRLTQTHFDELTNIFLPCMKLAIFTKTRSEFVSPIFKACCLISPKLVLPVVLDMVYPALETLIEPHRLIQTLSTLIGVLIPLVKDQPDAEGKTYRIHAITILNSLLPGLDRNDISKCMVTYQVVGVLVNLIPLVDCSEAVHLRNDLTDDERELCSATANFENIISMVMDRMLDMIVDCGQTASTTSSHGHIAAKTSNNIEDSILHRGTISVFKGMCRNSSTLLYKVAIDKLYNFVSENVFDSKIASDTVSDMVHAAVKLYPEQSFLRFLKLIIARLQSCLTPEFFTEEKVDFHCVWWLTMASRVLRVPSHYLLKNWDLIRTLLDLVLPLKKCTLATERALGILDAVLDQLCSIYVISGTQRRINNDKPLDEYLAIRNWSSPVDKKIWNPVWHLPNKECIDRATEIFNDFVMPNIVVLSSPQGLEKKEVLHRQWLIRFAVMGAACSLPLLEGPLLPLSHSPVINPEKEPELIVKPEGSPYITLNGKNVRQVVLDSTLALLDYLLEHSADDVKSIQEAVTILRGLPNNRGVNKEMFSTAAQSLSVTKAILCDRLAGNRSNIELIVEEYILLLHKKRIANVQGYDFKQQHVDILRMLLKVSTSSYSENRIKAQSILMYKLREHPYSYKYILDDVLYYVDPQNNVSHEQLKGALYLLIDGKKQALALRMDYDSQSRIWPALVALKHSEKPSIIKLMENGQTNIVENYESYRMKYEWSPEAVNIAKNLLSCADISSPLQADWLRIPSDELMAQNAHNLEKRYAETKEGYLRLTDRLVALANDPSLHWRPIDLAHSMLSMLIRRDEPYSEDAVRLFVRLLVHDSVKTRRVATAVVASWLKITKPRAVKREYVIKNKDANTGPGAKFPIKYGLRDDNRIMMYEEEKLPQTDEEWDAFQFCGKQHWAFYTWPAKLITYAPLKEQKAIDRDESDFTETEKFIVETFQSEEFMKKVRHLYAVEEKKGEEIFNAVHFALFQGLFRTLNEAMCPVFREHLEILTTSTKEADQKLAAEMIAGLVNGSKLWKYEKQRRLWNWLAPLLTRTFETIKEDSLRNWGVALATMCGCSEARLLKPLLDVLFKLLERPTENAFAASSRLFLMQSALCQFEWRGIELWNRFMVILKNGLVQQYANLRDRVAVSLTSATWYDLPTLFVSPNFPDSLRPPLVESVINLYQEQLVSCWEEVRVKAEDVCVTVTNGEPSNKRHKQDDVEISDVLQTMAHSASSGSLFGDSEVKRQARLALKATLSYVFNNTNQSYIALPPSFIGLFPLFCHYSNDVGDEELQRTCASLTTGTIHAAFVSRENAPTIVQIATQILNSPCWWKAKVALLRLLRMIVFSNVFVFVHHREEIGLLLVNALGDCQLEVREKAAEALSALLQAKFFEITPQLVEKFSTASRSSDPIDRHGGVLGLSAIVLAFPYSVPDFLPGVLMKICRFATEKHPIKDTVKRALGEFKRTHQDSWREHEAVFNEDQLLVLRDLLISPNYYV